MKKVKLVIFDMEGVLLKYHYDGDKILKSVWSKLANYLGEDSWKTYQESHKKWKSGKYKGYLHWVNDYLKLYHDYGLTKPVFLKFLTKEYYTGVREVLKVLRKRKIKTAIVSGGFKKHVDLVADDLQIDHRIAACELKWKGNKYIGGNVVPFDEKGKKLIIDLIRKGYGFEKKECVFIGDGNNDVYAAKAIPSIAFNATPKLQKVCKYKINQGKGKEDLRAVLKYL